MIKLTKIQYIAAITLLLMFQAGCGKAENHVVALPEPEDMLKTAVETLYENKKDVRLWQTELVWYDSLDETTWGKGTRYYGAVDGAEIFYVPVAGGPVRISDGNNHIYVDAGLYQYIEGEFRSLFGSVGVKGNVWSEERMRKAMELHRTYSEKIRRGSVFVYEDAQGLGKLSSKEQKAVETAWWNTYNSELSWTFEKSPYKFSGNYDGIVVIHGKSSGGGSLGIDIPDWDIAGVGFSKYDDLWACCDGEVLLLGEAYERGWLDKEDLLVVQKYCEVVREK